MLVNIPEKYSYECGAVDWAKIIKDLENSGLSQKKIALATGFVQPSISRRKNRINGDPKFTPGLKMIQLWNERCNS